MTRQTVEDARTKKHADDGRAGGGDKKKVENIKVGCDKEGFTCITIVGESFRIAPMNPPAPPVANTIFTATSTLLTDELPTFADPSYQLEAFLATEDGPHVSPDWNDYTANAATPSNYNLYSDTGASVHISPVHEDFISFASISPHAIHGFQGSSIDAMGVGTIINDKFALQMALFVPNTAICLMSVSRLCHDNSFTCHFDATSTWIADSNGKIVCTGSLHQARGLYNLDCFLIYPSPSPLSPLPVSTSTTVASAMPTLRLLRISTNINWLTV
jgi:hypothetical protein